MPFPFACPSCTRVSQVPDHMAGTQAKCPTCGVVVNIPRPTAAPPPVQKPPPRDADAVMTVTPVEDREPPKKSGFPLVIVFVGLALGFLLCGGTGVGGFLMWRSLRSATTEIEPGLTGGNEPFDFKPFAPPAAPPSAAPGFDKPLAPEEVYKQLLKSTAWIIRPERGGVGIGSGGLVHADKRLVVTNAHVVGSATEVVVFFPELSPAGEPITSPRYYIDRAKQLGIKGSVVSIDPGRDIALVKLDRLPTGVVPLRLAPKSPSPGQTVFSIGASGLALGGPDGGALWRYTTGQVRGTFAGNYTYDNGQKVRANVVETQSPTNPGDSGGPMVDDRVRLVAVVSSFSGGDRLVSTNIDVREVRALLEDFFRTTGETWTEPSPPEPPGPPPVADEDRPAEYWLQALRDADPALGERARDQLAKRGAAMVPELRQLAQSEKPQTRMAAVAVLGKIGPDAAAALPQILSALTDSDAAVRVVAAQALGQLGPAGRQALPQLIRAAGDPHPGVREAVKFTLKKFTPFTRADAPRLADLFKPLDPDGRLTTARTVREYGLDADGTVAVLGPFLTESDPRLRREAAEALGEVGHPARPAAFPLLFPLLRDRDETVRTAARTALDKLAPPDRSELKQFRDGLRDPLPAVRRYSAECVAALGRDGVYAVPELTRNLTDPDAGVRSACLDALAKVGAAGPDVLKAVLSLRTDPDPGVRAKALQAAGSFGREEGVLSALFAGLDDDADPVRAASAKALADLKPPLGKAEIPLMEAALKGKHGSAKRFAAEALAKLGLDAAPVLQTVKVAMADRDPEVRRALWGVVAAVGPEAKGFAPLLVEQLDEALTAPSAAGGDSVRQAVELLDQIGAPDQALPLLRRGLKSRQAAVRKESAAGLGRLGPAAKDAVPDLVKLFDDAGSKDQAIAALVKIGKDAVPAMVTLLDPAKPARLQLCAIRVVEQIGPDAKAAVVPLALLARNFPGREEGMAARAAMLKIQGK